MTVFISLQAPDFSSPALMPNGVIDFDFNLSTYRENKKAILFFYAMNFSQVDPTELIALSRLSREFENRNTKIIAISTDTFLSHQMYQTIPVGSGGVGKLPFPLVSDYTKSIAKGYDVIMNDAFPMRATFILDNEGYVRHQSINDFPIGRNINEIMRIIDAIDFYLEVGELCPANWKKGQSGISHDDEFAQDYINKLLLG